MIDIVVFGMEIFEKTLTIAFQSESQDNDGVPALFYTTPRPGYSDEVLLRPIKADVNNNTLSSEDSWHLDGNVTDVLAVSAGVSNYGPGVFALYKGHQDGKRYVHFRNNEVGGVDKFSVDFPVHDRMFLASLVVRKGTAAAVY